MDRRVGQSNAARATDSIGYFLWGDPLRASLGQPRMTNIVVLDSDMSLQPPCSCWARSHSIIRRQSYSENPLSTFPVPQRIQELDVQNVRVGEAW